MEKNDPVENSVKNREAPQLPQPAINSFLSGALQKALGARSFANLGDDLNKHVASLLSASDWTKHSLGSFEPMQSPFQKLIHEVARTAAVYQNMGSLAQNIAGAAASLRASADLNRE